MGVKVGDPARALDYCSFTETTVQCCTAVQRFAASQAASQPVSQSATVAAAALLTVLYVLHYETGYIMTSLVCIVLCPPMSCAQRLSHLDGWLRNGSRAGCLRV